MPFTCRLLNWLYCCWYGMYTDLTGGLWSGRSSCWHCPGVAGPSIVTCPLTSVALLHHLDNGHSGATASHTGGRGVPVQGFVVYALFSTAVDLVSVVPSWSTAMLEVSGSVCGSFSSSQWYRILPWVRCWWTQRPDSPQLSHLDFGCVMNNSWITGNDLTIYLFTVQ